ncbi:MAG: hypothetical protein DRI57_12400 [Deltaproteobacteria bacterium]|nr:MAG: hypothetical protein DRI57_12400 [Deltaproteobacteria bacterium]
MHEKLTYDINGCLFEVFRKLGNIWNEDTYESAAELELRACGMETERQKEFDVFYFDRRVGRYRIDLLVDDTMPAFPLLIRFPCSFCSDRTARKTDKKGKEGRLPMNYKENG